MQNRIIRIIAGVPPRTNCDQLYKDLNILPVKKLYLYAIGFFMYRYVNGMLPELFDDMFVYRNSVHEYSTRTALSNHMEVPFSLHGGRNPSPV